MSYQAESLARTIIGIIGNVISFFLFISPAPTFVRIWKKKSVEDFHPYPYLASVMNCMFWLLYGIPVVHPDSTLVITISSVGLALELSYLTIFALYTHKNYRVIIALALLAEAVFLAIVVLITILCFPTHATRSMFVGIICVVFGIVMYGSPGPFPSLQVFRTTSAKFLPFWLCLAGFFNGAIWFTYAFLKTFDPYMATGNGIGGLLRLFQLSVFVYFSRKGAPKEDDTKPSHVQLQNTNLPEILVPFPCNVD